MILVSEAGDDTAWPLTEMMTSPPRSPAVAAAVLQNTPSTSAPDFTGAIFFGMVICPVLSRQLWLPPVALPNPPSPCSCSARCRCGLVDAAGLVPPATMTPRNPPRPILMSGLPRPPAAISRVIETALSIGIA